MTTVLSTLRFPLSPSTSLPPEDALTLTHVRSLSDDETFEWDCLHLSNKTATKNDDDSEGEDEDEDESMEDMTEEAKQDKEGT